MNQSIIWCHYCAHPPISGCSSQDKPPHRNHPTGLHLTQPATFVTSPAHTHLAHVTTATSACLPGHISKPEHCRNFAGARITKTLNLTRIAQLRGTMVGEGLPCWRSLSQKNMLSPSLNCCTDWRHPKVPGTAETLNWVLGFPQLYILKCYKEWVNHVPSSTSWS